MTNTTTMTNEPKPQFALSRLLSPPARAKAGVITLLVIVAVVAVAFVARAYIAANFPPTIHPAVGIADADLIVKHVYNRTVTSLQIVSVDRGTILWELHSNANTPLRDSHLKYGKIPRGFHSYHQRVPDVSKSRLPGEPLPLESGELLIASIEYIDDHYLAPGMGKDFIVVRNTGDGIQSVDVDGQLATRINSRIQMLHSTRAWHVNEAEREESRNDLADCVLQLADWFQRTGDATEGQKWLDIVARDYGGTPASERVNALMKRD